MSCTTTLGRTAAALTAALRPPISAFSRARHRIKASRTNLRASRLWFSSYSPH